MYCSACGVAINQGTTYCNYCGAKVNPGDKDASPDVRPGGLVTMMVATFVMGTFVITLLMGMMKAILHFEYGPIMGITLLSFLIMLMLEGVFIRLLFRRKADAARDDMSTQKKRAATKELEAGSSVPIEPFTSVTEHTTRAFDHVPSERK